MPRSDHISWYYLKVLIADNKYVENFVNFTSICINIRYWPIHFKRSTLTIIPKLNKVAYNSPKAFQPIVLLNMFG